VKDDGIVLVIGLQGGAEAPSFNLQPLMRRRLTLRGSTLRARSDADKARIVRGAVETLMPFVTDGSIRPLIDSVFDVRDAAKAHEYLHAGTNVGKVVLTIDAEAAAS
jgi:NADPH2:quinone reductase